MFDSRALRDLASLLSRSSGLRVAAVPVDADPLEFVRAGSRPFDDAFYFASPGGRRLGGLGVARRFVAAGPDRFSGLAEDVAGIPAGYPLLLGSSFSGDGPHTPEWDGFAAAAVVLPSAMIDAGPNGTLLRVAVPPGADHRPLLDALVRLESPGAPVVPEPSDHAVESKPSPAEWRDQVAEAVAAIRAGAMRKVVLSRSVAITTDVAAEPFDVVHTLAEQYPRCYAFGWQMYGGTFVGASPELLVDRRGNEVAANPLAGSAPRGEGEDEDRYLGQELMTSGKDRIEHALVVEDIAARLGEYVSRLDVPAAPSLARMATVQHLSTHIGGTLRGDTHVLELTGVLHPTPAVGGTPRDDALAFIAKVESAERGWYTGAIGWVEAGGDGEVALALRCGVLRGPVAHLFAGAGIVADSDPERELVETRLKFKPLLDLLTPS